LDFSEFERRWDGKCENLIDVLGIRELVEAGGGPVTVRGPKSLGLVAVSTQAVLVLGAIRLILAEAGSVTWNGRSVVHSPG
jgi:hypothetical protein